LKEWAIAAEWSSLSASPSIQPIAIVAAAAAVAAAPAGDISPVGISNVPGPLSIPYIAPVISSPGVSSILSKSASGISPGAQLTADDVPAQQIVRAQM
ncbi:MAG: hypothetical protein ACREQ4_13585, partial [Candidatus Binataceae bacterium]